MIQLTNCKSPKLKETGPYADMVQGGFWEKGKGDLAEGFISVEDMNEILKGERLENGLKSIQLQETNNNTAKLLLTFDD